MLAQTLLECAVINKTEYILKAIRFSARRREDEQLECMRHIHKDCELSSNAAENSNGNSINPVRNQDLITYVKQ